MPDSYPNVTLDDGGICTLCRVHERSPRLNKSPLGKAKLLETLKSRQTGQYDCIVPVSGGKDSSYALLYVVRELGVKPLAICADSGFVSDTAKENIRKICEGLAVDLVVHQARFRRQIAREALTIWKNRGAFFTPCPPCETNNRSVAINEALKRGIPFILWGASDFEDDPATFFNPDSLTFRERFARQIDVSTMRPDKRIRQKLRGTGTYLITETLKSNISFTRKIRTTFHVLLYLYYMIRNNLDVNVPEGWRKYLPLVQVSFQGKEVQTLYLYDYIPYDPPGQVETLKRELGWEAPLGKEAKLDCKLHPIASYQSLMANGISSDGFTFCVLIRYGLMSRTQAQEKEALLRKSLAQDCERSLAELGFSASELLH